MFPLKSFYKLMLAICFPIRVHACIALQLNWQDLHVTYFRSFTLIGFPDLAIFLFKGSFMRPPMGGGLNLPSSHFYYGQSPCSQIGAAVYFPRYFPISPIFCSLTKSISHLPKYLGSILPNLPKFNPNLPSPKYPIGGLFHI